MRVYFHPIIYIAQLLLTHKPNPGMLDFLKLTNVSSLTSLSAHKCTSSGDISLCCSCIVFFREFQVWSLSCLAFCVCFSLCICVLFLFYLSHDICVSAPRGTLPAIRSAQLWRRIKTGSSFITLWHLNRRKVARVMNWAGRRDLH